MNPIDLQHLVDCCGSVDAAAERSPFTRNEFREMCREAEVTARPRTPQGNTVVLDADVANVNAETSENPPDDDEVLSEFYGDVLGVLRSNAFPEAPQCFIVQYKRARAEVPSRWLSMAVYDSYQEAQAAIDRWEETPPSAGSLDRETGEIVDSSEPLAAAWSVATLLDVVASGPQPTWEMLLDFMLSDHEWYISTEIGSPFKLALHTGLLSNS